MTAVALAIARRSLRHVFTNPALLVPSLLFPLIFLVGFAGGLSSVGNVPGFHFASGYTAFQFIFVFLQSAAFGGVFTGFGIARDFESGFARRLLLAAPERLGILVGYAGAAVIRFLFTAAIITPAALIAGMHVDGSPAELLALLLLGALVSVAATLFAAGIAFRLRTMQAAPLMQTPIFIILFLAPVYVPRNLLTGWIHAVASVNPTTALLQAGRGLISGAPETTGLAFACVGGLIALLSAYAVRGLRKAEASGG